MNQRKKTVLFLGYGYCASFLSDALIKEGSSFLVLSSRRRATKKMNLFDYFRYKLSQNLFRHSQEISLDIVNKSLSSFGFDMYQKELDQPSYHLDYLGFVKEKLAHVTDIIITAPPKGNKDPAYDLYKDLFIKGYFPNLKWLGYLSATSVYGDLKGAKCDEMTPTNPVTTRGERRLRAEALWQDLHISYNIPTHIFRLTGIYGPMRNNIQAIKDQKIVSIIKDNHLGNRIYIKDIVHVLMASMNKPTPGEIFNVTDDLPASSAAVNEYVAFLIDKKAPPIKHFEEIKDKMTKMRQSFFMESKIVQNNKIKEMLDLTLLYPTYRDGISDILNISETVN